VLLLLVIGEPQRNDLFILDVVHRHRVQPFEFRNVFGV